MDSRSSPSRESRLRCRFSQSRPRARSRAPEGLRRATRRRPAGSARRGCRRSRLRRARCRRCPVASPTGANMASAAPKAPNRKSPPEPKRWRQSRQISHIRAMSSATPGPRPLPFRSRRRRFMGMWLRRALKPACISQAVARATAACITVRGPQAGLGVQLVDILENGEGLPDRARSPCNSTGTRPDGDTVGDGLFPVLVEEQEHLLGEGDTGVAKRQPGPERPRRVILVADDQGQVARCHVLVRGHPGGTMELCLKYRRIYNRLERAESTARFFLRWVGRGTLDAFLLGQSFVAPSASSGLRPLSAMPLALRV